MLHFPQSAPQPRPQGFSPEKNGRGAAPVPPSFSKGKPLACSRLRDSWARWIESVKTKVKREEIGTFRVPFTFASSPLSESLEQAIKPWGPFPESPVNFSGPKSNIQIEIKRVTARVLASKLLRFVSLTDSFIMLDAKLLKPRSLMETERAYRAR